mgnify:CR=1 FL=1
MTEPFQHLEFDRPAYLALALALPWIWWWGRRSAAVLGSARFAAAATLRSIVWLLVVAAAAEMQWVRRDDRLSVLFLLDRSHSVPEPQRRAAIDFVNGAASTRSGDDAVGAIVFGRDARLEAPPFDEPLRLPAAPESTVDARYTNLAEALRLAQAAFPDDAAKRIVLVSDGNQNVGDALSEARRAADQGIGIDVVPIDYRTRGEVLVEKVSLPSVARRGEPFDLHVVLNHTGDSAAPPVAATLEIVRRRGGDLTVVSREPIELPPGKRPFAVRQTLNDPDFYEYEARLVLDDPRRDVHVLNNRASGFTQVEGSGRVLLIEDFQRRGAHDRLIAALRRERLDVTVMPSNRLFTSPAELVGYDAVVLADVARSSGTDADDLVDFTDEQLKMLVSNVREFGSGLTMIGGPNSFGAGGWTGSPIEEALPVDFQIKNVKIVPSGALLLVLDRSGSMEGEKLAVCRAAAIAAVKVLSTKDYAGVIAFDSMARWVAPLRMLESPRSVLSAIGRLNAGGGTNLQPALEEGYPALQRVDAAVKHVIVMTDGHTSGTGFETMAAANRRIGITTTAVAVGADADVGLLERIAQAGGGKFYLTSQLAAIPRIFIQEAKRVARPLVYEDPRGFAVVRPTAHEVLRSLRSAPPPLTGFVLTRVKRNPLVQVLLEHPKFASEGNGTIAATWTYGLGRTAAWTTDVGQAWASQWTEHPEFDALPANLIRWTLRPPATGGRFALHAEAQAGEGRVVVSAVDDAGEYVNLLDPQGTVVGPDQTPRPVRLEQTAPGRYTAKFAAPGVGNYFVVVRPGPGLPALRTGVNVAYSDEFRDREPNRTLLASLASLTPAGGRVGRLWPPLETPHVAAASDFFRRDLPHAAGHRDLWPDLLSAALVVFTLDVFVRRVAFELRWLWAPAAWLVRRLRPGPTPPTAPHLERLRSRKEDVARSLAEHRASPRFQSPVVDAETSPADAGAGANAPPPHAAADATPSNTSGPTATGSAASSSTTASAAPSSDDYIARLRKAKDQARRSRSDFSPSPPSPPSSEPPTS